MRVLLVSIICNSLPPRFITHNNTANCSFAQGFSANDVEDREENAPKKMQLSHRTHDFECVYVFIFYFLISLSCFQFGVHVRKPVVLVMLRIFFDVFGAVCQQQLGTRRPIPVDRHLATLTKPTCNFRFPAICWPNLFFKNIYEQAVIDYDK